MKPRKTLGQIAYSGTGYSDDRPWHLLSDHMQEYYENVARAVERELLKRLEGPKPLLTNASVKIGPSSACMIKRKKK